MPQTATGYTLGVNLLLFDPAEVTGGRVRLDDRRAEHIIDVLDARPGDQLRAGIVRGAKGTAIVTKLDSTSVDLELQLDDHTDPAPSINLVLAVPRPKELSRILQTVASFGAARIDLVNAWRVDKSYLDSKRLSPDRLATDVRLGCEQGSTTWVPDVVVHRRLMPFVDDALAPRLSQPDHAGIVAHPSASQHVEDAVAPPAHTLTVAIGPEGGWIPREIDTLVDRGFAAITLGPRVLRTHAAVAAVFAQLDMLRRTRG